MNTLNRLKSYIDKKGLNIKKFEKINKFSNGSLSSQFKKNKTIGVDRVENILKNHTDLNPTWLLTGKGNMILNEDNIISEPIVGYRSKSSIPKVIEINPNASKSNTLIADVHASAGIGNIIDNHSELEKLPSIHIPDAPSGLNVAFQICGDSMSPTIRHLDFVAANKINDPRDIRDGHTYILIDVDEGVLCKRIYSIGADWKIQSDNPIYPPYSRSKHNILSFFRAFCRLSYDFTGYHDDFRKEINDIKKINKRMSTLEDGFSKLHKEIKQLKS